MSIQDVLRYNENIKDSDMEKALEASGLTDKIFTQKQFSEGEKQRICMTRLLCQTDYKPDYIFLDEPTSNIPEKDSYELIQAIIKAFPESGIVITSHQETLTDCFDTIIKL